MIFSIIIFIITLLILVLIHELGHFLFAKRFGIKVEEFGFGIPPRAWGKKIGETLISINWLPLGGFVRLFGEDEVDKKVLEDRRSFASQTVEKRILVVIAGVLMNIVLAWILFYGLLFAQNFRMIYPTTEPVVFVVKLEDDFPAKEAGIKVGERVLSVDGVDVNTIEETRGLIKKKEGQEITLTLSDLDKKNLRDVTVTPKAVEGGPIIGVVFSPLAFKQYVTPIEKIFSGITYSLDLTKLTFSGFGILFSDLISGNLNKASQSVSGPVGLASVTNNILSIGLEAILPFIWFVGVLSLSLGIFNLLPIPALDGGRLFFLLIEFVTRKRVKAELERIVHQVGFAALLALALLVTYSDISKVIK
ncbi:MAG: M50 family metallopeptidase [Patescibacteria group bacterium]